MEITNNKEYLKILGKKLQNLRINEDLSQERVAEITGISKSSISLLENGHNISVLYLILLFKTYNKLEEFFNMISLPEISPILLAKLENKKRKKATRKKL